MNGMTILPVTLPLWLIGDGLEVVPDIGSRVSYRTILAQAAPTTPRNVVVRLEGIVHTSTRSGRDLPANRSIVQFEGFDCLCDFRIPDVSPGDKAKIEGRLFVESWLRLEGLSPLSGTVVERELLWEVRGREYKGNNPRRWIAEEYRQERLDMLHLFPEGKLGKFLVGVLLTISS